MPLPCIPKCPIGWYRRRVDNPKRNAGRDIFLCDLLYRQATIRRGNNDGDAAIAFSVYDALFHFDHLKNVAQKMSGSRNDPPPPLGKNATRALDVVNVNVPESFFKAA